MSSSISNITFLSVTTILLVLANSTEQKRSNPTECYPTPNVEVPQYIVGYGYIIQTSFRLQKFPGLTETSPVSVSGFCRGWSIHKRRAGFSLTGLNVEEDSESTFNGAVFKLPEQADVNQLITDYDNKEIYFCRQKVTLKNVKYHEVEQTPFGEYWIYVGKPEYLGKPNNKYPIAQSTVDIFLSGCFEIEDKFALTKFGSECVVLTHGWSKYWVNDRIYPRQPDIYIPDAIRIDDLLEAKKPIAFKEIQIE